MDHFPKCNPQQKYFSLFSSFPVTQIVKADVICVATVFIQKFYRDAEKILHWLIFMYHCLQLSTAGSLCHSQEPLGNQLLPCKGFSFIQVCCLICKKKKRKISGRCSTPLLAWMAHCSQRDIMSIIIHLCLSHCRCRAVQPKFNAKLIICAFKQFYKHVYLKM